MDPAQRERKGGGTGRNAAEQNKNIHTHNERVGWHLFYLQSFNSEIKLI